MSSHVRSKSKNPVDLFVSVYSQMSGLVDRQRDISTTAKKQLATDLSDIHKQMRLLGRFHKREATRHDKQEELKKRVEVASKNASTTHKTMVPARMQDSNIAEAEQRVASLEEKIQSTLDQAAPILAYLASGQHSKVDGLKSHEVGLTVVGEDVAAASLEKDALQAPKNNDDASEANEEHPLVPSMLRILDQAKTTQHPELMALLPIYKADKAHLEDARLALTALQNQESIEPAVVEAPVMLATGVGDIYDSRLLDDLDRLIRQSERRAIYFSSLFNRDPSAISWQKDARTAMADAVSALRTAVESKEGEGGISIEAIESHLSNISRNIDSASPTYQLAYAGEAAKLMDGLVTGEMLMQRVKGKMGIVERNVLGTELSRFLPSLDDAPQLSDQFYAVNEFLDQMIVELSKNTQVTEASHEWGRAITFQQIRSKLDHKVFKLFTGAAADGVVFNDSAIEDFRQQWDDLDEKKQQLLLDLAENVQEYLREDGQLFRDANDVLAGIEMRYVIGDLESSFASAANYPKMNSPEDFLLSYLNDRVRHLRVQSYQESSATALQRFFEEHDPSSTQ